MATTTLFKKMKASSYSSSLTECLPEDLMTQILVHIPIMSLLRFRLLSKAWYNFIRSPYFISMHKKFNSATASQLLMCSRDETEDEIESFYLPHNHVFSFYSNDKSARVLLPKVRIFTDPDAYVHVVANSCNGIVCYYDLSPSIIMSNLATREFNRSSSIFLSNPATREFRRLPLNSCQQETEHKLCRCGVAFGFDSANMYDLKVLSLFDTFKNANREPSDKGLKVEMFTLSSNTWKQLHWGLDGSVLISDSRGVFCANSFHFSAHRHEGPPEDIIVSFDIRTERFKIMELPPTGFKAIDPTSFGVHQGRKLHSLMVLKGFLSACIFNNCMNFSERSLEIWIMKDYGVEESWTKLYNIGPPWGLLVPRCFWIEDDALLLSSPGKMMFQLVSLHLNTSHGEHIKIDGYEPNSQLVVYKETLVSII